MRSVGVRSFRVRRPGPAGVVGRRKPSGSCQEVTAGLNRAPAAHAVE